MALCRALGASFDEDFLTMAEKPTTTRPGLFADLRISDLETALGHQFADPALLRMALTHPSLGGAKGRARGGSSPYERLEFLGDRVLGLIMAETLYKLFPDAKEGELAKRHAALVNRDALRRVAKRPRSRIKTWPCWPTRWKPSSARCISTPGLRPRRLSSARIGRR
jgi:hypothetical protein